MLLRLIHLVLNFPTHHHTTLSNTFGSPASGFSVSESSSSYKTRIYRIKLKEQAWQVTALRAKGVHSAAQSKMLSTEGSSVPPTHDQNQVLTVKRLFGFGVACVVLVLFFRKKHHSVADVPCKTHAAPECSELDNKKQQNWAKSICHLIILSLPVGRGAFCICPCLAILTEKTFARPLILPSTHQWHTEDTELFLRSSDSSWHRIFLLCIVLMQPHLWMTWTRTEANNWQVSLL